MWFGSPHFQFPFAVCWFLLHLLICRVISYIVVCLFHASGMTASLVFMNSITVFIAFTHDFFSAHILNKIGTFFFAKQRSLI